MPKALQLQTAGRRTPAHCAANVLSQMYCMAKVHAGQKIACYVGLASGSFKSGYHNHTNSFCHKTYEKETELS